MHRCVECGGARGRPPPAGAAPRAGRVLRLWLGRMRGLIASWAAVCAFVVATPLARADEAGLSTGEDGSNYELALAAMADGDEEMLKWLTVLADTLEPDQNSAGSSESVDPADVETLAQLVDFRGAYSEAVVEFEDLVHGALQDDPEQIELVQGVLEKWVQVGVELEFEDPDDEITQAAKALAWVASKFLKVAKCLPFDTCSPKDAWWAAREGRAAASEGTKWHRVLEKHSLKLSIMGLGGTLSEEMQKGYQVGGDFGGWKDKQAKWEKEHKGEL